MPVLNCRPKSLGSGEHDVVLKAVEQIDSREYGRVLDWCFEAVAGPEPGAQYTRRTGSTMKPGSSAWNFVEELSGKPIAAEMKSIDTDDFVGKKYRLRLREQELKNGRVVIVHHSIAPLT